MDWSTHYNNISNLNLDRLLEKPDEWQILLAEKLQQLTGSGHILEAGCGFGVTSLLIEKGAQRTLLDLEPKAIETARQLFSRVGQHAEFETGDLFAMNFPDNAFDVVFNAGVLEHFDTTGRREALREMARVTRPGGIVCVAIPNHFSVPYRFAYEYRKARGKWPYPDEEKIFDLSEELVSVNDLTARARETIAKKTCFHFLTKLQRIWFKFCNIFVHYEGYLTILTFEKSLGTDGNHLIHNRRERV